MDKLDCVVVGAGVVGLAVARSLALAGRDVIVLEAEDSIGKHCSSRNSEVIHAGIYYPENSLKARLCIAGRKLLYQYCEHRTIPYRRLGKFIVATAQGEAVILRSYLQRARSNGLNDLVSIPAIDIAAREPQLHCIEGLWSPATGIIDSHAYLQALRADLEQAGGVVLCNSRVYQVDFGNGQANFSIAPDSGTVLGCKVLINAAGAWAQQLIAGVAEYTALEIPVLHLAKGHYYAYQADSPFQSLVYPIATGGGLGIHATCDMSGMTRFGPDVRWLNAVNYDFDDSRREDFVHAIRRYFPGLRAEKLQPAYAGVRPKLSGMGESAADFVIQGEAEHGITGLVNLFGIESPGLTASLAIAGYVNQILNPRAVNR